jgi:hypothetical protein
VTLAEWCTVEMAATILRTPARTIKAWLALPEEETGIVRRVVPTATGRARIIRTSTLLAYSRTKRGRGRPKGPDHA